MPSQVLGDLLDGLDLVVHEVDLAAAPQFAQHRFADRGRMPFGHRGADGDAARPAAW